MMTAVAEAPPPDVYLDELSHHGRSLCGTRSGQSSDTFGDGTVRLFVRQRRALGINWTGQHPQKVHVAQPGRLSSHQSLNTREESALMLRKLNPKMLQSHCDSIDVSVPGRSPTWPPRLRPAKVEIGPKR